MYIMNQPTSEILTSVFKKAFSQTKGNVFKFLPILIIVLLGVNYLVLQIFSDIDTEALLLDMQSNPNALEPFQNTVYLFALISLLLTPIEVGLMLMGVKASRGLTIRSTDIFAIFSDSAKIVILAFVLSVFTQIGFSLLILPGIFLLMMTSMAQPLMCDYRLSMVEAVKRSFKICYQHIGLVIPFYLVLCLLIIASFFTFGIALIVTIPFYLNAKGVLYCHLFDTPSNNSDTQTIES